MHELEQEFEILFARLDCLITLVESGAPSASEHLVPALKEQADKTKRILAKTILEKTITDFRTFDAIGDEEESFIDDPVSVRVEVSPSLEIKGEEEEEEEDEEEDEEEEEEEPIKED